MRKRAWSIVLCLMLAVVLAGRLRLSHNRAAMQRPPVVTAPAAPVDRSAGAAPARARAGQPASSARSRDGGGLSAAQALREVQALVNQGKIGAARDLAEQSLKRIPDGPEAAQIQSLTGVHPHP